MTREVTIFIVTILNVTICIGQTNNRKDRISNNYSNWVSLSYINCLKKDLPCECEKSREYFLINLDTTQKFVLLYEGRDNYNYLLYYLKSISSAKLEVYDIYYSQTSFKDTVAFIGHTIIQNDTLVLIENSGKQTRFIQYSTGENDNYLIEHIKLIDSAMAIRGYDNLNKTLQTDNLKCWCNWELDGGINIVYGLSKNWILQKKDNELYIYEWTNPPTVKTINLKIVKRLLKILKW